MNVLICDPISSKGVDYFRQQPQLKVTVLEKRLTEAELLPLVTETEAMVVRSETKITRKVMEAAPRLKVVGRAGVGVDNVDVETATARGIVVMNTPAGNTISTAELTFSMLMSLARKIPQANASMKSGDWNRKAFSGTELYNKTLGILGMGRIGGEVAKRAIAFGMKVLAYDPYLTPARAEALQVELVNDLDKLYPQLDFLTVHMPMTEETRGMINAAAFARMKKGVRVLNCARGGIINETDLLKALDTGQVAGAALDVYETEPLPKDSPLRGHAGTIMTPHLGASTDEAQENVGSRWPRPSPITCSTAPSATPSTSPTSTPRPTRRSNPICCWAKSWGVCWASWRPNRWTGCSSPTAAKLRRSLPTPSAVRSCAPSSSSAPARTSITSTSAPRPPAGASWWRNESPMNR